MADTGVMEAESRETLMAPRAGIYVRISRDVDGDGLGVARQDADCRLLAGRLGWGISGVYVENDTSATRSRRRPEWERLLADLEAGTIDAVLAYSSSRLYRRPADLHRFCRIVQDRRTMVQTVVSGTIDLNTADGVMLAGLLATIDQGEADRTSERSRRKNQERADSGTPFGGARPFGYAEGGLTQLPDEADLIRRAAEDLLNGVSARTIVRRFNADGVRTSRGKVWEPSSLRAVLTGYRVAGRRQKIVHDQCQWEGDVQTHRKCSRIDGGPAVWEPILDRTTWDAVRAFYAGNERRPIQTRRHLLTNLAVCATCGEELVVKTKAGTGQKSYTCPSPAKNGTPHAYIAAEPFQEVVARYSAEATIDEGARAIDPTTIARDTRDALDAIQHDLDDLATARYVEKVIDDSQFLAAQRPLRERQAALRLTIDAAEAEARLVRASAGALFDYPAPDWVDHLRENFAAIRGDLESKIARVVVSPGGAGRPSKPKDAIDGWREAAYRQRAIDRIAVEYQPGVTTRADLPRSA